MIRFSDISGNPVMDTSTATSVGKVQAPLVDPITQRVFGFRVKRSKGPGDVVLWEALSGLGPDALTVDSVQRVAKPPEQWRQRAGGRLDLIGRIVLTEHGHELGKVRDVEFDPSDGRLTSLILREEFVQGDRLLGIGSHAVVVSA